MENRSLSLNHPLILSDFKGLSYTNLPIPLVLAIFVK
jgi:hypothetical protein